MIKETIIDEIAERLEALDAQETETLLLALQKQQPDLWAFLDLDRKEVLSSEENDLLLYIGLIIWQAFLHTNEKDTMLQGEIIEEEEEKIWGIFADSKGKFRDRITPFFEKTTEEDLLAFIEDSLSETDDLLSTEGRDVIFVATTTILNTFISFRQ